MKLLEISIETYFKTLDGKIYFQGDGLPIEKSISKPLAGIYMHWFERTYVFNDNNQFKDNIVFWKRQVDDIFFVWKGSKEELELFVWLLNGVEYRVQFTLEVEKEGFLPFLDVGLMKADGKLVTRIYTKPTHTQQYINWNSNHPKNMLLGVLKGLIHRAHVICDLTEDLLEELDLLKDIFIGNGYPEHLVTKTLNESWPRETLKAVLKGVQQDVEVENQKDFFEVLHAPYAICDPQSNQCIVAERIPEYQVKPRFSEHLKDFTFMVNEFISFELTHAYLILYLVNLPIM